MPVSVASHSSPQQSFRWTDAPEPVQSNEIRARSATWVVQAPPASGIVLATAAVSRLIVVSGRIEVLDVASQIISFYDMRDGWMGNASKAPDILGVQWLAEGFVEGFDPLLPTPSVFPTQNGGVEMEWRKGGRSAIVTVSFDKSRTTVEWFSFYPEDDHDERDVEKQLELDKIEGWRHLNHLIKDFYSIV